MRYKTVTLCDWDFSGIPKNKQSGVFEQFFDPAVDSIHLFPA